jgi:hypothetical protein
MKKIVLLLAALVLFSSFVYADVSVGIWGRTVFNLVNGSSLLDDPNTAWDESEGENYIMQSWGPDWGGSGPQMGIKVWWTSDLMEYHFKYKFNDNNPGGASIPEAWGMVKILPEYGVTLQMGYREEQDDFRQNTATTFHDMHSENCGRLNGWSAIIMVAPPDSGLKVGLQYRTSLTDYAIQYNLYNVGIAATYTVPEMIKITVGSMVDGEAWTSPIFPTVQRNIFGRIHLLMVPDLTLWLLAKYTGIEPAPGDAEAIDVDGDGIGVDNLDGDITDDVYVADPNSVIDILLGAKYSMGDISIALGANITMNTDKEDDDEGVAMPGDLADPDANVTSIHVNIDPEYNLGKMSVGGVFGVEMRMIEDIDDYDEPEVGPKIYVEPYVKIHDLNMNIAFKYEMNGDFDTDTDDYKWSLPIQVDFSFW